MDFNLFKEKMVFLQSYFGKSLTTEIFWVYWNMLKTVESTVFNSACSELIKTFSPTSTVPFPLIKNFNDAIILVKSKRYIPREQQNYLPSPDDVWLPGEKEAVMKNLKKDLEKIGISL